MNDDKLSARWVSAGLQLVGTVVILAFVPGSIIKALALLAWWAITFRRLTAPEGVLFVGACIFFTGMNALSLRQGIFAFAHPDVLGIPAYELFMWGFYLLHTSRLLRGPVPGGRRSLVWLLAILYAAAFGGIADADWLLLATGALLLAALACFHEPLDFAYVGYMILLGALVEQVGVHSGEWHYPGDPLGGVPLWFITLWGGVGLFLRRLVLPVLTRLARGRPVLAS